MYVTFPCHPNPFYGRSASFAACTGATFREASCQCESIHEAGGKVADRNTGAAALPSPSDVLGDHIAEAYRGNR